MKISVEEGIVPNGCLHAYNETDIRRRNGLADFAHPGLNRYCFVNGDDDGFDEVKAIFPKIISQLEGDFWWVVGGKIPEKLSGVQEYLAKKTEPLKKNGIGHAEIAQIISACL